MIKIRRSDERGHANHGWLDTHYTFSFADYHDPAFMGFRALRVINEDFIAPGRGFGTHGHRDMEIISYVLEGSLGHKDNMGTGSVIRPGEVQRMSAGTGVLHSEENPSRDEQVHLLQIWLLPERRNLTPEYEQKAFPQEERDGTLRLVASQDGREGSVTIHTDASLYTVNLDGTSVAHELAPGRHGWLQVALGTATVNGELLAQGDGAAISNESRVTIEGTGAEVLLFDLG